MNGHTTIDSVCGSELVAKRRKQEHLAKVAMSYLAGYFGEDRRKASDLVKQRDFSRLQTRIHVYEQTTCRYPRPAPLNAALRHVRGFIRDQAPVIVPSRPDAKPARNNDGGRRQQARRGLALAGT